MGKLPIIPQRGTRDNAKETGEEEKATAPAVVGGDVARSSVAGGAIAGSVAGDRDCPFLVVRGDVVPRGSIDRVEASPGICARRPAEGHRPRLDTDKTKRTDGGVAGSWSSDLAYWRWRRDAAGVVVVGATRLRRNTWHADRLEYYESAVVAADSILPSRGARLNAISDSNTGENRRVEAPEKRRWNGRVAGDDRTCCAIDAASLHARRTRDSGPNSGKHAVARRNRRGGKSIGALADIPRAERIRGTADRGGVGAASTELVGGPDRFSILFAGTTNVSECDGNILSKSTINNTSERADASGRSLITVSETRDAPITIGNSAVNAARVEGITIGAGDNNNGSSSHQSGPVARLVEIGIVDISSNERSCYLAEEAVNGATLPSAPFGKTIARLVARVVVDELRPRRTKTDTFWRSPPARLRLTARTLLLGLLAMSLLCDAVLAAPSSPLILGPEDRLTVDRTELAMSRNELGEGELEIIRKSIVQGLGLQRIPDSSKANVSQAEYERAHREYLKQVQLSHDGQEPRKWRSLHVFQPAEHPGNSSSHTVSDDWRGNHRHSLYFPITVPDEEAVEQEDVTVDHASLRFLLLGDHRQPRKLEVLVYLRTPDSRRLLLRNEIPQADSTKDSRWLELDSTEIAAGWFERDSEENRGVELEFLHDGRPTRREISQASLNVFTTSEPDSGGRRRKRFTPEELLQLHMRRSECKGYNSKRCCRHEMTVMFKDLKGFDFIVYPRSFDAGYCKGRCPPLYNPAHHHALLQSLLWKEDRKRVPKPCCAPSKLNQLMVVYFDEKYPTKLQVSYWKDIMVEECACS